MITGNASVIAARYSLIHVGRRTQCWVYGRHNIAPKYTTSIVGSGVLSPRLLSSLSLSNAPQTSPPQSFPFQVKQTSGRSKKRMQRRLRWKRERQQYVNKMKETGQSMTLGEQLQRELEHDSDKEEEEDNRTWRTILFPPVYDDNDPDEEKEPPIQWPKTLQAWRAALSESWVVYKGTWEGFFSNVAPTKESDKTGKEDDNVSSNVAQDLADNAKKNMEFAKQEGEKLLQEAQNQTGIYTVDDLKQVARNMMTVATAMLSEFMKEYRKGRDEEVEKMLNEYFQEDGKSEQDGEQGETTERRRRRKPKRRIPILCN